MSRACAAIFDQDGLLFDTEVIFERCWKQAGAERGLDVPDAMTHACCGCGTNELPNAIRPFFPDLNIPTYISRVFELVIAAQLAAPPVLKPGTREILARCRAMGLRTAIATSSIRRLVDHNLATTGLTAYIDEIVTGQDVSAGKPAPDIYLLAARRLGVPPSECLVFEDAFTGIRAAHAAGCRPVLVPDRLIPTPEILEICTLRPSLLDALDLVSPNN